MYETLLREATHLGIDTYEKQMPYRLKGLYSNNIIWINNKMETSYEKACILAEELGHYHTSSGDIVDQDTIAKRRQEKIARTWAYERLVPLSKIVQAHKEAIRNRYELAQYLEITEEFLDNAIKRYKEKYGATVNYGEYSICFEPLGVIEWFDNSF
ncbi:MULTISPECIES: ImmA/IrrE family metallo-endopeptidase [Bacillus]|uniref:ImmA/IrrE family metallo-endopeptidase n=1 Tax=Bacillus TaxID=1386 RepID=UPI0011BEE39D|nr:MULTISPECIES: ImmA/IrrE family metallo-endopeptidase [Bacillus]MCY7789888.1 ImmA/IrrE family metallo-endopeptidase [Bacillus haynesii]MCY8074233.1 ImmA/IrrE family metallo-endopeptidase [Bacillus haynesii]MCY9225551.1 ImmA/IrrE family metallo-endopeptidase [Bacillus haynesii]MEC1020167.1 ImmA/IrrE family metallo-endopeptidase [Bacillus paralicheniformis]MEC1025027.1 ImmA/IrrE family metallo-endopeptidase [Bacillus paralicheniformis]